MHEWTLPGLLLAALPAQDNMSVEPRRGCGYRKIGGLYLIGSGSWSGCDRLPYELTVCPTCSAGIKQSRGWTWLDWLHLADAHKNCTDKNQPSKTMRGCVVCWPPINEKVGLLWIGERFYPTPDHFKKEAVKLGISRRIPAVPHDFIPGKTWVFLAHPKAIKCESCDGTKTIPASDFDGFDLSGDEEKCQACSGKGFLPGIITAFCPTAIEKILPDTEKGSTEEKRLRKQGIRPVFVPANDKDHQPPKGNYDDD